MIEDSMQCRSSYIKAVNRRAESLDKARHNLLIIIFIIEISSILLWQCHLPLF